MLVTSGDVPDSTSWLREFWSVDQCRVSCWLALAAGCLEHGGPGHFRLSLVAGWLQCIEVLLEWRSSRKRLGWETESQSSHERHLCRGARFFSVNSETISTLNPAYT